MSTESLNKLNLAEVTKKPTSLPEKTPARNRNTNEDKNKNELAEVLKTKSREVDTLLEQMKAQAKNKKVNFILLSHLTL